MSELSPIAKQWVIDHPEEIEVLAGNADSLSFWYMGDGHWFERLHGKTLDEIIAQAEGIRRRKEWDGQCGMLCPVTVMRKDKELRRVGEGAHCRGLEQNDYWLEQVARWRKSVEADEQVMRLLAAGKVAKRKG